jgi:hypothetical protein
MSALSSERTSSDQRFLRYSKAAIKIMYISAKAPKHDKYLTRKKGNNSF